MPDPAFSDRDTLDATACVNLLSALRPVVETVSALDAARYCNRSKRTIHRAIHQGLCPSATRDTIGDWRIPRADLDAFKATVQSIKRGRPEVSPLPE